MARFEMFTDHRRPCFIRGQKGKLTKAFFHCFVSESEPISPCRIIQLTYAIVETENGQVHKINPTSVIFNNGGKFKDYDWSYEEKEKENV